MIRRNKMKRFVITMVFIAVIALALGTFNVAYAQSSTQAPGTGTGWMGGRGSRGGIVGVNTVTGEGILHEYMIAGFAEGLGIPVADLEARLDGGETMAQIALSTGLTIDQFRTLLVDVRSQAIDQALNDGTLTQEQADWIKQHGAGQMAGGQMGSRTGMRGSGQGQFANPACPYNNQTSP
jgi:hypothetical protein